MEWGINTYLQSRKGNAACEQADYLTAAAPSMARILRDAGYATGHFGKWHMGGRARREGRAVDPLVRLRRVLFDMGKPRPGSRTDRHELDLERQGRRETLEPHGLLRRQDARFSSAPQGQALLREPLARRHAHAVGPRRGVAAQAEGLELAAQLLGGARRVRPSDRPIPHAARPAGTERQHHRHLHLGQRSGPELPASCARTACAA